jgi:hypothetical protein
MAGLSARRAEGLRFDRSTRRRPLAEAMDLVRGSSPVVRACVRPPAVDPAALRCAICGPTQRRRLARGLKLAGDGDHELLRRPDRRRRKARALRGAAPERRVAPSHARRDPVAAAAPRPEEPTEETLPGRSVERRSTEPKVRGSNPLGRAEEGPQMRPFRVHRAPSRSAPYPALTPRTLRRDAASC